jgi:CAAX prenyl protease-like protein
METKHLLETEGESQAAGRVIVNCGRWPVEYTRGGKIATAEAASATGTGKTPMESSSAAPAAAHGPERPWQACLLPMVGFLTLGVLEPTPSGGGIAGSLGIPYSAYPWVYAMRLAVTAGLVIAVWPALRPWLGRPAWWPPLLGLALVVPWVVLAALQRDAGWTSGLNERVGFDPWAEFGPQSPAVWAYLALRGLGLVVVVPLVEELFLRGFLLRYVVQERFWEVPFGLLTPAVAGACAAYAAATHPNEAVAAVGWFAVVSGIAAATRRPIDCVLAHAATNLALGAWVLATGAWWLV